MDYNVEAIFGQVGGKGETGVSETDVVDCFNGFGDHDGQGSS